MYLYVHKWESLKVYFKVIKFEVIRFPRLQSLRLFLRAGDLDRGRGKGYENKGCELSVGVGGLIYIERLG